MHVVQALSRLSMGGSELVATELTEYLTRAGHRTTVLAGDGPLSRRVRDAGAEFLDWPVHRKRLQTLSLIGRFCRWLDEHQPDLVHAHSRLPAWLSYLAIRRLPIQRRPAFVTTMHGQYTVSPYSAVMARGDLSIAVSEHVRRYTLDNYRFINPRRLHRVYGGISRDLFPHGHRPSDAWKDRIGNEFPELAGKRWLLLPGRLSRYKGHATFLELLAATRAKHPDVHGVILGISKPGSRYMAELEGLAERNGVLDAVTFVGLREDMRDWMAASAIVYNLCSDPPEAFGRTVPEALHLGVPVLAWAHGGVREVLLRWFPEGAVRPDSLGALVEATERFLDRPPVVPTSQDFGLTASMDNTLAVYHAAMEYRGC